MRIRSLAFIGAVALVGVSMSLADTITTTDGTIFGGVLKQVPNGYEITSPDGRTTFIPTAQVKSIKLSNDGKVNEQDAKERLASLRRSVDSETQIDRIIDRYTQFIDMNKQTDAAREAAKDLQVWETRKRENQVKVGAKWMTPAQRDEYLRTVAKLANEIADQISAGDINTATRRLAEALEEDPFNLSLAYLDGVLQVRRNRMNEAKRSFDIVYGQIPDHPPTVYNEAALAAHFKRWPVAIPMFEKVMTLAPNHPEILNGVTEFLRLLPDTQKRSAAYDRLIALYDAQEAILAAEMAKKGLYRFGSGWADQAKIDEMKRKLAEFEEKQKALQSQIDASADKMRQLAADIDTVERRLAEIERDRITIDPITGRTAYLPRPSYYYDLAADRDRYIRDLQSEKVRYEDFRKQGKELEKQAPQPPFAGRVMTIGEAGVPIVLPGATADPAPPAEPSPATQATRPPLPLWPPADAATTQPSN